MSRLSSIAESIRSAEEKRKALANFLKEKKDCSLGKGFMEEKLVHKVFPLKLSNKKILAVDGGLSYHSYQGIELALVRAVAVLFEYDSREKLSVYYYPSAIPSQRIILISDSDTDINNERQHEEIETAIEAAKRFSPDLLLMDGMIVPHINDIPKENSESHERFVRTLESFKKLYDAVPGLLAGCIEDSRGKRFCEILSKNLLENEKNTLENTSDMNFLYYLLEYGERTSAFRFSGDMLINILGEHGKNIYSFYIKTAKLDRPLRVDFYSNPKNVSEKADRIASLVLSSCCHDNYGFPAPLIEADFRAKLPEDETEKVRNQILDRVGLLPCLMKLRRELRPI